MMNTDRRRHRKSRINSEKTIWTPPPTQSVSFVKQVKIQIPFVYVISATFINLLLLYFYRCIRGCFVFANESSFGDMFY